MEVMGLMLGEFVDDYTISVVDVFAMPQNGTGVSVEAVDAAFQAKMLEMLKVTNRCASCSRKCTCMHCVARKYDCSEVFILHMSFCIFQSFSHLVCCTDSLSCSVYSVHSIRTALLYGIT